MKERGLSKDEAFMVETASAAEVVYEHKKKKDKHKAAFGEGKKLWSSVRIDFFFAANVCREIYYINSVPVVQW